MPSELLSFILSGLLANSRMLLPTSQSRASSWDTIRRKEKCIDDLGCFSANDQFYDTVEGPDSLLPDDREVVNTQFLLYTPLNPTVPQNFTNIHGNVRDILKSCFNPRANTKFVVPGFMSEIIYEWKKPLVDALMADGSNVFLVDWSGGDGPVYEQAVANTRIVGAEIALFIRHLQEIAGVQPERVHIIGHSLGCHVAGYAGKRLKNLGRITAMDPAGPFFVNVDPRERLDRDDALFVDVYHTNAAPSIFKGFGLEESIGHVDFYPNGGHHQPGCSDVVYGIWSFLAHPSLDSEGLGVLGCNHLRAIYLFSPSKSDTECELMGTICENWEDYVSGKCGTCKKGKEKNCIALGMKADRYVSMIKMDQSLNVYLNTTDIEPYCL